MASPNSVAERLSLARPLSILLSTSLVLHWLQRQPNFKCYNSTGAISVEEPGSKVTVKTEGGSSIECEQAVEATCIPLQKLSTVAEMQYDRTYAIAIRVPIGGCDHRVGQGPMAATTNSRCGPGFPQAGSVDYRWSGQIYELEDYMAFIRLNSGSSNVYIVAGDSVNGLTCPRQEADLRLDRGEDNPWSKLYSPKRFASLAKPAPTIATNAMTINKEYKRLLQTDISDIDDLVPGSGAVLNPRSGSPLRSTSAVMGKL